MEHTKGWQIASIAGGTDSREDGRTKAPTDEANACRICQCVNLHDALMKGYKYLKRMKSIDRLQADGVVYLEAIEQAIAQAEAEK